MIGLLPTEGHGKLSRIKAAKIIDNYGIALTTPPTIIRALNVAAQLKDLREKNAGVPVKVLRKGRLIRVPTGRYIGVWKVFSAKANMKLDLDATDKVGRDSAGDDQFCNVLLSTAVRDGLEILPRTLMGIASPS